MGDSIIYSNNIIVRGFIVTQNWFWIYMFGHIICAKICSELMSVCSLYISAWFIPLKEISISGDGVKIYSVINNVPGTYLSYIPQIWSEVVSKIDECGFFPF